MKANLAGISDDICLKWEQGVFVAKHEPQGMLASIEHRADERAFLAALDAATAQGRNVSDYKSAQNYAPRILATLSEAEELSVPRLEKAMQRLFNANELAMGEVGKGADRHKRRGIIRAG
jgi:RecA-family ATPase